MGGKVKEAGGGPATPLANDFVSFLRNGLSQGTFTNPGQGGAAAAQRPRMQTMGGAGGLMPGGNQISDTFGLPGGFQQNAADNYGRADPVGSTEGIAGVINKFLGGDFGAQQYKPDTAGLQGIVGQGKYNFDPFNVQGADFSQFNTDALKNFDSGINLQGFNAADVGPGWDQAIAGLQNGAQNNPFLQKLLQSVSGGQQQFGADLSNVNIDPYIADMDRSRQMGLANERARFGAQGGSAFGTPAAFAESNFLNEEAGKRASTLAGIGQSQQALDLQRQLGVGQINSQNYGQWLGAMGQGAGIQNQGGESALNALLGRANMQNQAALGARGQDLDAMINKGQMSLQALSQATGLDLQQLQSMSQQGINIGQLMNQYQGMRADNQLGSAGLDSNILNSILGHQGNAAQLNEQMRQFDNSSQGNMLSQLLNLMGGLSGKGISQRETYYKPSAWETAGNVIGGIGGAIAPFAPGIGSVLKAGGGMVGGSGGMLGGRGYGDQNV